MELAAKNFKRQPQRIISLAIRYELPTQFCPKHDLLQSPSPQKIMVSHLIYRYANSCRNLSPPRPRAASNNFIWFYKNRFAVVKCYESHAKESHGTVYEM